MQDKTILITGGTGTFGHEMVRNLLSLQPKKIIVYSRDELKQYEMHKQFDAECLRYFIGDVRDRQRLSMAMYGVDYVFHAAALKQVPTCEYNPFEAIKTNIHGAENVIQCALANRVEKVILLSSDKSVNPINLYGATKLCSEKLFVAANSYGRGRRTKFSVVRYGNILASRGSVLQSFVEQVETGVIEITSKEMTRFWWGVGQAIDFVLQAIENMQGGEIFVPLLESSLVSDLASAVCPQCRVRQVGIRPGEKLHESLIAPDEVRRTYHLGWCFCVVPELCFFQFEERGVLVAPDFSYCSNGNLLNREQMIELIKGIV